MSARGFTRGRPHFSNKELQHRRKLEKEKKNNLKGDKKVKKNLFWFITSISAFLVLGGTLMPIVDIMFEDAAYSMIMVWIFGLSATYITGDITFFFYFSTIILGIVLVALGVINLKISYDIRQEKQGKWSIWLIILSAIEIAMLILGISLIILQKSFFTSYVGYTASLNDVNIFLSLGFYSILIGALLGFVAVGWDKLFKYRREKEKEVEKLEE